MAEITDIGIARRKRMSERVDLRLYIDLDTQDLDVDYDLPDGVTEPMLGEALAFLADHIRRMHSH